MGEISQSLLVNGSCWVRGHRTGVRVGFCRRAGSRIFTRKTIKKWEGDKKKVTIKKVTLINDDDKNYNADDDDDDEDCVIL